MKRFLLSALATMALFVAGRWLVHALASDETRIRWRLEDMADGFNRTRTDACLAGLALDFRDETYGAERQDVRQGLARIFFEKKDPVTRGFLYRLDLPRESIKIDAPSADEMTAQVEMLARFFEQHGEEEELAWETRIKAEVVELDGDWYVRRTEHETLAGRLPR
jgi:hypothetical protein